jgi:NAD/NADP transhydrogenase beta subunit
MVMGWLIHFVAAFGGADYGLRISFAAAFGGWKVKSEGLRVEN